MLKVFDESVHEGRGSKKPTPVLIEAVQVFPKDVAVRNLLITRYSGLICFQYKCDPLNPFLPPQASSSFIGAEAGGDF